MEGQSLTGLWQSKREFSPPSAESGRPVTDRPYSNPCLLTKETHYQDRPCNDVIGCDGFLHHT